MIVISRFHGVRIKGVGMEASEMQMLKDASLEKGLRLQDFTVSTVYPQPISAQADSEIEVQGAPVIRFILIGKNKKKLPVNVALIRGGSVIQEFTGNTPFEVQYADLAFPRYNKSYYRLVARSQESRIISHPIFVRKGEDLNNFDDN